MYSIYKNKIINATRNNEVAIIKKAGVKPINCKLCNLVFAPTADIAIKRHHLLTSLKKILIEYGIKPKELIKAQIINNKTKEGIIEVLFKFFLVKSASGAF